MALTFAQTAPYTFLSAPQSNLLRYAGPNCGPQQFFRIQRHPDPWNSRRVLQRRSITPTLKVRTAVLPRENSNFSFSLEEMNRDCESLPLVTPPGSKPGLLVFLKWRGMRVPALVLVSVVASACVLCGSALAGTESSIKASGTGLRIAEFMRKSGWPDEVVVLVLAALPVLELRGAIPVGYWMQLPPLKTYLLSVVGNMVPIPFILLYLRQLANFVGKRSSVASNLLQNLFEGTRKKAGPIEEFQWLGLMLFVAVPFPGTGAWTGAFAATLLDMPFWDAFFANFFGVVLAGLLVNLLVNLGIKYAIIFGAILFFISTVMWSFLRYLRKALNNRN